MTATDTKSGKACCLPALPGNSLPESAGGPPTIEARSPCRNRPLAEIPGATTFVGTRAPHHLEDGEAPPRQVRLRPFRIACHATTNADFAEFVEATGYVTEAERLGWSCVFANFLSEDQPGVRLEGAQWWVGVDGADWQHPEGPGSTNADRPDHPVVHVSWSDAAAYAAWAGGRLPTEAEWEYAARGGLPDPRFPWGDREPDDAQFFPCNIWQGDFPGEDQALDGFAGPAPVESFAPNGYGLFNMVGNTWEWTASPFRVRSMKRQAQRIDSEARAQGMQVLKGGSYLCHRSYCYRYRIAARTGSPPSSATGHVGFRVAWDT